MAEDGGMLLLQNAKQIIVTPTSSTEALRNALSYLQQYQKCFGKHILSQKDQCLSFLKMWYNLTLRFLSSNQPEYTLECSEVSLQLIQQSAFYAHLAPLLTPNNAKTKLQMLKDDTFSSELSLLYAWASCIKGRCLALQNKEIALQYILTQNIPLLRNFRELNTAVATQMCSHCIQALVKLTDLALKRNDKTTFMTVVERSLDVVSISSSSTIPVINGWAMKLFKLGHSCLQPDCSRSVNKTEDVTDSGKQFTLENYERKLQEFHQFVQLAFQLLPFLIELNCNSASDGGFSEPLVQCIEDVIGVATWMGLTPTLMTSYGFLWIAYSEQISMKNYTRCLNLVFRLNEISRFAYQRGHVFLAKSLLLQGSLPAFNRFQSLNRQSNVAQNSLLITLCETDLKLTKGLVTLDESEVIAFVQDMVRTINLGEVPDHQTCRMQVRTFYYLGVLCFKHHYHETSLLLAEAALTRICEFEAGGSQNSMLKMKFLPSTLMEYAELAECFLLAIDLYSASGRISEAAFFVKVMEQYLTQQKWLPSIHYSNVVKIANARLLNLQQRSQESLRQLDEITEYTNSTPNFPSGNIFTYHHELISRVLLEYGDTLAESNQLERALPYFTLSKSYSSSTTAQTFLESLTLAEFRKNGGKHDLQRFPSSCLSCFRLLEQQSCASSASHPLSCIAEIYLGGVMIQLQSHQQEGRTLLQQSLQRIEDGSLYKSLGYFMLGMLHKCQINLDHLWSLQQQNFNLKTEQDPGKENVIQDVRQAFHESYKHQRWVLRVPETKKLCLAIASVCGRKNSTAAAFFLNMTLGNTFYHQMTSAASFYTRESAVVASPRFSLSQRLEGVHHGLPEIVYGRNSSGVNPQPSSLAQLISEQDALSFMNYLTSKLPEDYLLCTVCLSEDKRRLYVTRIERHVHPSVVMAFPLTTSKNNLVQDVEAEMNSILTQNQTICGGIRSDQGLATQEEPPEVTSSSQATTTSSSSSSSDIRANKNYKKEWWDNRKRLDLKLGQLLQSFENQLLGNWKGIFLGSFLNPNTRKDFNILSQFISEELMSIVSEPSEINAKELNELTRILLLGLLHRFGKLLVPLFLETELHPKEQQSFCLEKLQESIMQFLMVALGNDQVLQASPTCVSAYGAQSPRLLHLQTKSIAQTIVKELRKFVRVHGKEIFERNSPRQHIVLILDSSCHSLPWESLPVLSQQSISRVPSLLYLCVQLETLKRNAATSLIRDGIEDGKVYYFLNPQKDLTKTQARFQTWLESKPGWRGLAGVAPTPENFEEALQNHHLILYFGHGSGKEYLKSAPHKLSHCGVLILMGCSSGKLKTIGELDPKGAPLDFLLSGSPCVLSNLWDVTDKDSDLFSMSLLQSWLEQPPLGINTSSSASMVTPSMLLPLSVTQVIPEARKACKLPFLTGAATVCYGLPVYVRSGLSS